MLTKMRMFKQQYKRIAFVDTPLVSMLENSRHKEYILNTWTACIEQKIVIKSFNHHTTIWKIHTRNKWHSVYVCCFPFDFDILSGANKMILDMDKKFVLSPQESFFRQLSELLDIVVVEKRIMELTRSV